MKSLSWMGSLRKDGLGTEVPKMLGISREQSWSLMSRVGSSSADIEQGSNRARILTGPGRVVLGFLLSQEKGFLLRFSGKSSDWWSEKRSLDVLGNLVGNVSNSPGKWWLLSGLEGCQKRWIKMGSFKIYFGSRIGFGDSIAVGKERRRN